VVLEGVSKSYGEGEAQAPVLDAASLELAHGQITSLTGVSGSGKSTLIALLAGMMLPDSGRVLFDGRDLGALDESERSRLRAKRVGVVLQSNNLIPFLTAVENVELAMELGGTDGSGRARELLSELELGKRLDQRPRRLSGGESQRVAVAMALANEPDLLLADEVTGELDSRSAKQVMEMIETASAERGLTALFVTHSSELAARAPNRLRLEHGKVQRI
jgi:putative ABC transport system ATP-binding protein